MSPCLPLPLLTFWLLSPSCWHSLSRIFPHKPRTEILNVVPKARCKTPQLPCVLDYISSLPSQILCLFCYCFLAGLIFIDVSKHSHFSGLAVMGVSLFLGGCAYGEHGLGRTPQWPWASALSGAKRPCWAGRSVLQSSLWSVSVTSRVSCFLVLFLCFITTTDWFLLKFI